MTKDAREGMNAEVPHKAVLPGQALAVALEYKESDGLPRIVSAGVGELARTIVSIAEQHGTPVATDSPLAELLIQAGVGNSIPQESLRAVAEILCFLYGVDSSDRSKIAHK